MLHPLALGHAAAQRGQRAQVLQTIPRQLPPVERAQVAGLAARQQLELATVGAGLAVGLDVPAGHRQQRLGQILEVVPDRLAVRALLNVDDAANLAALAVHRIDQPQHAACILGRWISAQPGQTVDQVTLAGIPAWQRLTRQGAIQQPLCLHATARENEDRRRRHAFVVAAEHDSGGQLLGAAPLRPRLAVGVQVSEQQPDTGQIDDTAVWLDELGLRQPGIPAVVEHGEHHGHL